MNCKQAEKLFLMSLEGRLGGRAQDLVAEHIEGCPACRKATTEYRSMLTLLRNGRDAGPLPRFWERLEPRLREEREIVSLLFWERWALRAIPVFLALVLLVGGVFFLTPPAREMTGSEALLLENTDPLTESSQIFSADQADTRNMMLIFAALEEKPSVRRPMP